MSRTDILDIAAPAAALIRLNGSLSIQDNARPGDAKLDLLPDNTVLLQSMAPPGHYSFIIAGVTTTGGKFRPSDWAERLCGIMSAFGSERRMAYSPFVQPGTMEGEKCVFVDVRIHDIESKAYHFLQDFATDNNLKVLPWEPGQD